MDDTTADDLAALHAAVGPDTDPAVAAALRTAASWVGDEVHLVGEGTLDDGTPCVVVHTTGTTTLPDEVDGVPVRVVQDDPVRATDDEDDGPTPDVGSASATD